MLTITFVHVIAKKIIEKTIKIKGIKKILIFCSKIVTPITVKIKKTRGILFPERSNAIKNNKIKSIVKKFLCNYF